MKAKQLETYNFSVLSALLSYSVFAQQAFTDKEVPGGESSQGEREAYLGREGKLGGGSLLLGPDRVRKNMYFYLCLCTYL